MTTREELVALRREASEDEAVPILLADLKKLEADDLPANVRIEPCTSMSNSTLQLALNGTLERGVSTPISASMEESIWRKAWNLPLKIRGQVLQVSKSALPARLVRFVRTQDLTPGTRARVHRHGHDGRRIVFEGTPVDLVAARSTLTGEHLAAYAWFMPCQQKHRGFGSQARSSGRS